MITKGQLKAENKVVVEQLQLGEKVDSADAVDLPIRLAIALLKDSDGKISIELPITGDLNNPQFSVMPIVWQTLRNLVVRAATAPFKFIGGLVSGGGSEDLGNVSFAARLQRVEQRRRRRPEHPGQSPQGTPCPAPGNRRHGGGRAVTARSSPSSVWSANTSTTTTRSCSAVATRFRPRRPCWKSRKAKKPPLLEGIYRTRLKQQPPAEWKDLSRR